MFDIISKVHIEFLWTPFSPTKIPNTHYAAALFSKPGLTSRVDFIMAVEQKCILKDPLIAVQVQAFCIESQNQRYRAQLNWDKLYGR